MSPFPTQRHSPLWILNTDISELWSSTHYPLGTAADYQGLRWRNLCTLLTYYTVNYLRKRSQLLADDRAIWRAQGVLHWRCVCVLIFLQENRGCCSLAQLPASDNEKNLLKWWENVAGLKRNLYSLNKNNRKPMCLLPLFRRMPRNVCLAKCYTNLYV